jgi:hypothetical protein
LVGWKLPPLLPASTSKHVLSSERIIVVCNVGAVLEEGCVVFTRKTFGGWLVAVPLIQPWLLAGDRPTGRNCCFLGYFVDKGLSVHFFLTLIWPWENR